MRKPIPISFLGAMAMMATSVPAIVINTYPQTVLAQTQGMERRSDRRSTRQDSRELKQACKAGDENSRAGCRQMKRGYKQDSRQGDSPAPPASPPGQ